MDRRKFFKNISDSNNMINRRLHEKPMCWHYWVWYDDDVSFTDLQRSFNDFLTGISTYDTPHSWQFGFQDPASPIMEGIIDLHHDLVFFMVLISVLVV
jgi:hypothetical protein